MYALFPLGRTLATPAALATCAQAHVDPSTLLTRHVLGQWGDLCADDAQINDLAVYSGDRILSRYAVGADAVYVITEADRAATTLLLTSEY